MLSVWKLRMKKVNTNFVEYCNKSRLHGFHYIGDEERPLRERILWLVAFVLSFSMMLYQVHRAWKKWEATPVIVSEESNEQSVWNLPFPAITVCNNPPVRETEFNYTHYKKFTDWEIGLDVVFRREAYELINMIEGRKPREFEYEDTVNEMINLFAGVDSTVTRVSYQKVVIYNSFQKLLTEYGYCYSFNMMPGAKLFRDDTNYRKVKLLKYPQKGLSWTPETGYKNLTQKLIYPYRGGEGNLFFVMCFPYEPPGPQRGSFKVIFHNPANMPTVNSLSINVKANTEAAVSITANEIKANSELLDLDPHWRGCYFSRERWLQFFQIYTKENCALECLANLTLKICGCVYFHMPRMVDTLVCGQEKIPCYQNAKRIWEQEMLMVGLDSPNSTLKCDCIDSCADIQYDFGPPQIFYGRSDYDKPGYPLCSMVTVEFKRATFVTSRRHKTYCLTDFLGSCGGLLVLGVGFSVLSVFEIIYWMFIRIWKWKLILNSCVNTG